MAKTPFSALRRSAAEIKRYRAMIKITAGIIGVLVLLFSLVYVITVLYSKYGSFTITVQKHDNFKYALSLSETKDLSSPRSQLNFSSANEITNIDGVTIPDYVDNIDGEHNGDNYAAYTFYCFNAGSETITYQYQVFIKNATNEIEKAVRIRLYVNGEPTTYAFTSTDGSGAEEGTVEFKTNSIVTDGEISNFAPGDATKFTLVIWLEGPDLDCVDKVIGGQLKVDMTMTVIKGEVGEN